MNKPYTIQVNETKQEIVKILNNSNLQAYTLKIILSELYEELSRIEENEYLEYNKYIEGKKESDKKCKKSHS